MRREPGVYRYDLDTAQVSLLMNLIDAEQEYLDEVVIPDLLTQRERAEAEAERAPGGDLEEHILYLSEELTAASDRSRALRVLFDLFVPF